MRRPIKDRLKKRLRDIEGEAVVIDKDKVEMHEDKIIIPKKELERVLEE